MVHACIEGSLADIFRKRCPPAIALLAALAVGNGVSPHVAYASATIVPISNHHGPGESVQIGNGKFNNNSVLVNASTSDRAVQGIRNGNAGGKIINGQVICRWKIRCKVIQRAVISDP